MSKKASNPGPPKVRISTLTNKHIALLGYKAKDRVTGFSGVVDSISFDLYGCVQASLKPKMSKDGKVPDGYWFDVNRLDIKSREPVMHVPDFNHGIQAEGKQGAAEKQCRIENKS